jgi:orf13 protein
MIMINFSETRKNVTIEVTGHGDDTDQSCARVSTVLDIIQLFFSKLVSDYKKEYGYTLIVIDKQRVAKQFLFSNLLAVLGYFLELKKLYPNSIKINTEKEVK